jgi:hypothetical protein
VRVNKLKFFYIFNNMDNIIEPNESFDFSKLSLAHPVGIQGGAYFTKIENNKKPLYIQTSKSQTRQGFVKTGKKYYCDLMFDKNSEELIHWFENLEEKCQQLIFERRDTWFQNSLEESDIETAFSSTIRIYKSGKFYLLRTNIKNDHNNLPAIKIYNEKETAVTMNDVNSETDIISILEIQGIKFTSRNFQIDIELKQVMILDNDPIFDSCLIKTNKKNQPQDEKIYQTPDLYEEFKIDEFKIDDNDSTDSILETNIEIDKKDLEDVKVVVNASEALEELEPIDIMVETEKEETEKEETEKEQKEENNSLDLIFEDLNEDIEENPDELKEVNNLDLSLENTLETMQLKKPNQVYFELYKEARNKAKLAKKNALLAYLEAKNIKKTYMIENMNDSDSEIDAEIDDVSESELEGL